MSRRLLGLGAFLTLAAGCELAEVALVDLSDVLVVEVYVSVGDVPADNYLRALVHGSSSGPPSSDRFDDAMIRITDGEGEAWTLPLSVLDECVSVRPDLSDGSCFAADAVRAGSIQPGEGLTLEVLLGDGRALLGATTVPGSFMVNGVAATCRIEPDTRLPLEWTGSQGAWAYLSEALTLGLRSPLADEGIAAPDSLHLLGLSIAQNDTTVTFPNQFGVFDRFDLDRDLAVRLQRGLPEGASAEVAITAVDENFANWVRGGSFNPSGAVRVSSLLGDGSGVFGASVSRRFTIVSSSDAGAGQPCRAE